MIRHICAILIIALLPASFASARSSSSELVTAALKGSAAVLASQEKGLLHFGVILLQSELILTQTRKVIRSKKWKMGKRPYNQALGVSYGGMPSGHVMRTWPSASYTRVFSEDYKMLSIPMYGLEYQRLIREYRRKRILRFK
jgi:hypothetical protein